MHCCFNFCTQSKQQKPNNQKLNQTKKQIQQKIISTKSKSTKTKQIKIQINKTKTETKSSENQTKYVERPSQANPPGGIWTQLRPQTVSRSMAPKSLNNSMWMQKYFCIVVIQTKHVDCGTNVKDIVWQRMMMMMMMQMKVQTESG